MTFDEMEGIAFGVMHMSSKDFYSMEYSVFLEALYQRNKSLENTARLYWEIARFETGHLMRPNLKNPNQHIMEFLPLPWDNERLLIENALNKKATQEAISTCPFIS